MMRMVPIETPAIEDDVERMMMGIKRPVKIQDSRFKG